MRSKVFSTILLLTAVTGIAVSRWLYPEENRYSIFTSTISFLGSPDAGRNPEGYLWYQVGMTALLVILTGLIRNRHRNFLPHTGSGILVPTSLYLIGLFLILISVWIPDSREIYWGKMRTGHLHTRIAIISIFTILFAVTADAVVLRRSKFRKSSFRPVRVYAVLWALAIASLVTWEWKCKRDPNLEHWPGEGIHSTPLWEWILFVYLIGFLYWISRRETAEKGFA